MSSETTSGKLHFTAASASSYDKGYEPSQLQWRTTRARGWQSEKFCDFPQELVFSFPSGVNLRAVQVLSHEYKVASKVEFFFAKQKDEEAQLQHHEEATWNRLGYISLDKNSSSNYRARELKTVKLDEHDVVFLKLVLLRCHINKYNLYNQVGIVGIGCFGDVEGTKPELPLNALAPGHSAIESVELSRIRPPTVVVPPNEDVVFELTFDEKTASKIRELTFLKERAVEKEDFEAAARLKESIDRLKSVGKQIADLEARKSSAVVDEDYDTAKMLKEEIDRLRSVGYEFGSKTSSLPPRQGKVPVKKSPIPHEPVRVAQPQVEKKELPVVETIPKKQEEKLSFDDIVIPTVEKGKASNKKVEMDNEKEEVQSLFTPEKKVDKKPPQPKERTSPKPKKKEVKEESIRESSEIEYEPYEKRIVDKMREVTVGDLPELEPDIQKPSNVEDDLDSALRRAFGDKIRSFLLSSQWSIRESVLKSMHALLTTLPMYGEDKDSLVNAACSFAEYSLRNDRLPQVGIASLALCKKIVDSLDADNEYPSFQHGIQGVVRVCVQKVGESNQRLRDSVRHFLLDISKVESCGAKSVVPVLVSPPKTRQKGGPNVVKPLLGRLTSILDILEVSGADEDTLGIPPSSVCKFCVKEGLSSPNGNVRSTAVGVLAQIYRWIGSEAVDPHIRDLRPAVLQNLKKSFEEMDEKYGSAAGRVKGKPVVNIEEKPAKAKERKPKKEVVEPKENNADDAVVTLNTGDGQTTAQTSAAGPINININVHTARDEYDDKHVVVESDDLDESGVVDIHTCQFCGVTNSDFTEETLDVHYWRECPMLTTCTECGQIVEVATLFDHLALECEYSDEYELCQKCGEAVLGEEFDQHSCVLPPDGPKDTYLCPLCMTRIRSWKSHFLGKRICPANERAHSKNEHVQQARDDFQLFLAHRRVKRKEKGPETSTEKSGEQFPIYGRYGGGLVSPVGSKSARGNQEKRRGAEVKKNKK